MMRGVLCVALLCGAAFAMSPREEELKADFTNLRRERPEPQPQEPIEEADKKVEEKPKEGANDWAYPADNGPSYYKDNRDPYYPEGYGKPAIRKSYGYADRGDISSSSESDGRPAKVKVYKKEINLHPDPYYPPHPSKRGGYGPEPEDVYHPAAVYPAEEKAYYGGYPPQPYPPQPYYGDSGDFEDPRAVRTKYYRDGDKICRKRCYKEGYRTACHKKCYKAPSKSYSSSYHSSSSKSSSSSYSSKSSSGSYNKKHLGCKVQCRKDYAGVRRCKKICAGLKYKSKSSKSSSSKSDYSSSSKSSSTKSSSSSSDSCESKKFRHGGKICVKTCCDGKCTKTCSKAGLKFYDAEVAEGAGEVKAARVANDAPAPKKRRLRRRKVVKKAGAAGTGKKRLRRRRKGNGLKRRVAKKAADLPVKA